ncbi:unnamed protein product [Pleuronectes platessa]|uniref:Uncharacterized protein n=1 Tax=Pleuronectes platessa TaxID=8262 RepID=A0A9N7VCB9_PLEPL|nr:unnamed protein product [Pleuronectes platessa]
MAKRKRFRGNPGLALEPRASVSRGETIKSTFFTEQTGFRACVGSQQSFKKLVQKLWWTQSQCRSLYLTQLHFFSSERLVGGRLPARGPSGDLRSSPHVYAGCPHLTENKVGLAVGFSLPHPQLKKNGSVHQPQPRRCLSYGEERIFLLAASWENRQLAQSRRQKKTQRGENPQFSARLSLPHRSQMELGNGPICALPGATQTLLFMPSGPFILGPDCSGAETEIPPPRQDEMREDSSYCSSPGAATHSKVTGALSRRGPTCTYSILGPPGGAGYHSGIRGNKHRSPFSGTVGARRGGGEGGGRTREEWSLGFRAWRSLALRDAAPPASSLSDRIGPRSNDTILSPVPKWRLTGVRLVPTWRSAETSQKENVPPIQLHLSNLLLFPRDKNHLSSPFLPHIRKQKQIPGSAAGDMSISKEAASIWYRFPPPRSLGSTGAFSQPGVAAITCHPHNVICQAATALNEFSLTLRATLAPRSMI